MAKNISKQENPVKSSVKADSHGASKFTQEKTLVLIKPDGVKRGLIGEVFKRVEQRGLKIIALKMFWPIKEEMTRHYSDNPEYLKSIGEKSLATYRKFGLDPIKEAG